MRERDPEDDDDDGDESEWQVEELAEAGLPDEGPPDADSTPKESVEKVEFVSAVVEREAVEAEPSPTGFVVSITKGGRFRRLHYVGAGNCNRIPGVDYANFEVWRDLIPAEKVLDAVCRNCFPKGFDRQPKSVEAAPASSDEDSAVSSSSGAPRATSLRQREGRTISSRYPR